jgi:hypothetical protein
MTTTTNPTEPSIVTTEPSMMNKRDIPTPEHMTEKVEEDRLALANAKFDLCCRQANIKSFGIVAAEVKN